MNLQRLGAFLGDPLRSSLAVFTTLTLAGLMVLALTWRGVAAQTAVADQVAFLTSGGLGGVALVGVGVGVLMIQARRLAEARRRAELERVVRTAAGLLEMVRDEGRDRR